MSNSPTLSMAATMQGVILGTAGYMSPEQARGKRVDKRADIWAFGVVLYELLTGKHLFEGEDAGHTLAAVIMKEPDFSAAPAQVLPLLKRCLEKDPKKRLRDIGDMELLLGEAPAASAPLPSRLGNVAENKIAWGAAALMAVVSLGVTFVHFRESPPADPVLHLSVPLPGNSPAGFLALSPDGRRLVLGLANEGKLQLWLRSLDSPQLQPLPGTEGARGPFWSPDSKSIGFFADGKLKTIPATGGPPQVLCEGTGLFAGGTWNRDGVILFSTSEVGAPLQRVNAAGGTCTVVTKPEGDSSHAFPEFLPDGNFFIYLVRGGDEAKRGLYVAALDKSAPRRLLADESSAVFAPSTTGKKYGYLLFLRGSDLMAQPFNAETLQLAGEVFPVAAETSFNLNSQIAASASSGGILVYETNFIRTNQLTWLDRSGKELGKVGSIQDEFHVALSPDGKTAATVRRGNQGIWLYDVQRGAETRFTPPTLPGSAPVWSPDGNLIAFGSGKGLYLEDASGGSKEELLLENGNVKAVSDWSRDGRYLIYTETDPKGQGDIWYLPDPLNKSSDRKPVKFQGTDAVESQGQLSPDGRWLAYASNESGKYEVYVRPFPSGPGRWKVSAGQGRYREPRWRRDGKELFFLDPQFPINRLMAVAVQSGPRGDFQVGAPQTLFEFRAITQAPSGNGFLYSPSADGQRFLVRVQPGDAEPTLNVITNWEKAALGNK
jgi:Tol biopolymer transport system component